MKIQLAYRVTGEDLDTLKESLKKVVGSLNEAGHKVYCPILDPKQPSGKKKIFKHALNKLDECDAILVLVKSDDKSEGMLMELGYAMAKNKKIIAVINKDVESTHLRELANQVIEFDTLEELYEKLRGLK